jgi:hypothetical protein
MARQLTHRALLVAAALALGCAPVEVPPGLASARIEEAWMVEYQWTAMGLMGGGLTGHAWLLARDDTGLLHEQYVKLRGGLLGFGFELSPSGGRTVELDLPPQPITGADLFERYTGSYEGFVVGFGFSSLHLKNEPGIQLDDQGVAFLMCVTISTASLQLVPAEPPPEPDTGETGDSAGDRDTDETGASGETGDTGETGTGRQIGDPLSGPRCSVVPPAR